MKSYSFHSGIKVFLPIFLFTFLLGQPFVHAVAPSSPTITSPPIGQTNISPSPTLSWSAPAGAVSYRYQLSTNSNFSTLIYNTTTSATSRVLYGMLNGVKYYWRVQARNSLGEASTWANGNFTPRPALLTNGNGGATDVGLWYVPYGGIGANWGPEVGYSPLIDANGTYRQHEIKDDAIMNFQFNEMANAKIDFIVFDNTNGGFMDPLPTGGFPTPKIYNTDSQTVGYVETSGQMSRKIKSWNDTHTWKIRYVQSVGATKYPNGLCLGGPGGFSGCVEEQAKHVWNKFVQNPAYGGSANYYHLDGKPLLILWGGWYPEQISNWYSLAASAGFSSSYTNKFTVRFAIWGEKGTYGWNIWGGQETHSQYGTGTIIDDEVELVSPGWYRNDNPAMEIPRDNGRFYKTKCWERVLSNKRPRIVSIVAFNDYWEHTAVWSARPDNTCVPPQCGPWTDENGIEVPGMYWSMTKSYISRLRGIVPSAW